MGFKRTIVDHWVPSTAADFKRGYFDSQIHNHRAARYMGQLIGLALLANNTLVAKLAPQEIVQAMRTWEQYDDTYITPAEMAVLLRGIDRAIPRNFAGERTYRLRFGRELSPVLYIERIGEKFTYAQCQHIRRIVDNTCQCDEFNLYGEGPDTIRIWWD